MSETGPNPNKTNLTDLPALIAYHSDAIWVERGDSSPQRISHHDAGLSVRSKAPLVVHAPATARRLRVDRFSSFDLLELYAFVRPASFSLPTPKGLAEALNLCVPRHHDPMAEAALLHQSARHLLTELSALSRQRRRTIGLAWAMARAGWNWGPFVLHALDFQAEGAAAPGIGVWDDLPEWNEGAPPTEPDHLPIQAEETRRQLANLMSEGAEQRTAQADFAAGLVPAFCPRPQEDSPQIVLAEAGTGVGKTLGYIAPASLWAQRNQSPVWISTYTRHLQHQIDQELNRLYPNSAQKAQKVVIRKGRENYLCLLNLAEMGGQLLSRPSDAIGFGLIARWALTTRDGDMVGGDLPGWLPDLIGQGRAFALADRRGECIYAACSHYSRCFIERSTRRAKKAEIVIANHALVMIQAAIGVNNEDQRLPTRYIFDEGHHLFSATDNAFAAHLTGQEMADLRRWLLGAEGGRSSRARGLKRRLEDLILDETEMPALIDAILAAARALVSEGWQQRLVNGEPFGTAELFLHSVRQQVLARSVATRSAYSLECACSPLSPDIAVASVTLHQALGALMEPMLALSAKLTRRLDDKSERLESAERQRIDAMARGLQRRGQMVIGAWRAMLKTLSQPQAEIVDSAPVFVDWFGLERGDGRELDVGMFRHYLDPTLPFAETVMKPAHGLVITSATLTDGTGSDLAWDGAETRSGTKHLPIAAYRLRVASPFDYARQTRVVIINDLDKDDLGQIAAAYRTLFLAAGGGALGLFTAIQRLREVHRRIAPALEEKGLNLLAQHVDAMDTATLIDIFRGDIDACLLGTDAVRDGVDVPGNALRLIVFDRVPWPRPDLLHRARKTAFGGSVYEDQLTRLKLKQAFGRLIRRADDHGVFILLDKAMPSRLLTAFPPEVSVERLGLKAALELTSAFLSEKRS